jgi:hypothetical protein
MKIRVEIRFGKKPVQKCHLFPKYRQKITGLGICNRSGTDLVIPNIWVFGLQNELWQPPINIQ